MFYAEGKHSNREETENPQSKAAMEKGQGGGVSTGREYIQSTKERNSLSLGKRLSKDLVAEKFIGRNKLRNSSEITSKTDYMSTYQVRNKIPSDS